MYQKGDEILRCTPFSHIVKASISSNVCDFCLQTTFENEANSFSVKKCAGEILKRIYFFKDMFLLF